MSSPRVDLQTQAQGRVAGAMALSKRFRAIISVYAQAFTDVQDIVRTVDRLLDIDAIWNAPPPGVSRIGWPAPADASGATVSGASPTDLIGRLVGQSRRLLSAIPKTFFGFFPNDGGSFQNAEPYGDRAHPAQGGGMYNRGDATTDTALMGETAYRYAIKARIRKNNLRLDGTRSWIDQMYDILNVIFPDWSTRSGPAYPMRLFDEGMVIELGIGRPLKAAEVALLFGADILPIPQGVAFTATYWDASVGAFGFNGYSDSLPMGDRAHPSQGGRFAERVTSNVSR